MRLVRQLIGSFLGLGYLPGPTGTYSSAATAAIMLGVWYAGCPWWGIVIAAAVCTVVGIYIGQEPERDFGGKDPRTFVLDETVGMLIAGLAAWTSLSYSPPVTMGAAFLWFRATDGLKPPPARQLERLPRGWGIVLDDVAAGLMALPLTLATLLLIGDKIR
jgi:phosphatidylglycerophosphatase A